MGYKSYRLGSKKATILDIEEYEREFDIADKEQFDPFGQGSTTWKVWHFKWLNKRGRAVGYESFGRDMKEARTGLERACGRKGFVQINKTEYDALAKAEEGLKPKQTNDHGEHKRRRICVRRPRRRYRA